MKIANALIMNMQIEITIQTTEKVAGKGTLSGLLKRLISKCLTIARYQESRFGSYDASWGKTRVVTVQQHKPHKIVDVSNTCEPSLFACY